MPRLLLARRPWLLVLPVLMLAGAGLGLWLSWGSSSPRATVAQPLPPPPTAPAPTVSAAPGPSTSLPSQGSLPPTAHPAASVPTPSSAAPRAGAPTAPGTATPGAPTGTVAPGQMAVGGHVLIKQCPNCQAKPAPSGLMLHALGAHGASSISVVHGGAFEVALSPGQYRVFGTVPVTANGHQRMAFVQTEVTVSAPTQAFQLVLAP